MSPKDQWSGKWVRCAKSIRKGNSLSGGSVANKWEGNLLLSIHIYGHSFKFHSSSIAKIKVYNLNPHFTKMSVSLFCGFMI